MLKTVQPVTNLQNYNKNITPVLASNHAVTLTKNGKIYGKILSPKQSEENEENNAFMARLFVRYIHKIGKGKTYSLSQAEKMLSDK